MTKASAIILIKKFFSRSPEKIFRAVDVQRIVKEFMNLTWHNENLFLPVLVAICSLAMC